VVRHTPLHEQTAAAGAAFVERAGWLVPAQFGDWRGEYEAARAGAALFDVSARGKIEAEGKDAAVFLHNLSTNDVKTLPPGPGHEVFFCTATAKVVGHGWVYRAAPQGKRELLWLDVDDAQGETIFRHLDHYLIGEDVALTDHSTELAQLHLAGPGAAALIGRLPVESGLQVRDTSERGWPSNEVLCPAASAAALWNWLVEAGARPAGREAWDVLRVEAGLPEFGVDMDDSTFAPETGRFDAISYQKGCYLGQEPIVMARDRGVVQRTLLGLRVGDEPAPAGSLLYRDGKEVGRVTSSVFSPRLGCAVALAYLRRGSQTPGMELQMDAGGVKRTVKVAKLPFSE
jgi:folate-binding protein YgfZ